MDETPIFFTPQLNCVIAKKGDRKIVIKASDQEKHRVTCFINNREWHELKQYFLFCGNNESSSLFARINAISQFKNNKAYFSVNKNGWMKHEIMERYIQTLYLDYIFETTGSKEIESILILDCATMNITKEDFYPYTKHDINPVFIPRFDINMPTARHFKK